MCGGYEVSVHVEQPGLVPLSIEDAVTLRDDSPRSVPEPSFDSTDRYRRTARGRSADGVAGELPVSDDRRMRPLKHGYTNRTVGDGAVVEKTYEGPDAELRLLP
jgi:hypothetical protein